MLCYLQEITNPSNTTVYIVLGWCILGVGILFAHCKWTHGLIYKELRTGLHAREYSSITYKVHVVCGVKCTWGVE